MNSDTIKAKVLLHPLIVSTLERLKSQLPKELTYHSVAHTVDVLHEALNFGQALKLSKRELELLGIAAVFHDSGFLMAIENHEVIGAQFAVEAMRQYGGYSESECDLVAKAITNTLLTNATNVDLADQRNRIEKCLLDADTSNLGRTDFMEKTELVRKEQGQERNKEYLEGVLKLLDQHFWHSEPAKLLRHAQKEINRNFLIREINSY